MTWVLQQLSLSLAHRSSSKRPAADSPEGGAPVASRSTRQRTTAPTESDASSALFPGEPVASVQSSITTVAQLREWTEVLSKRVGGGEAMEVDKDAGSAEASAGTSSAGSVTLSHSEALSLLSVLQQTLSSFLESPLTRNDLLTLVLHMGQLQSALPATPATPPPRPHARDLPADILQLIFAELRTIRSEMPDESVLGGNSGGFMGWKEMRVMAGVNRNWRNVARPLYLSEIHVADTRRFPGLSKFLFKSPARADCLTRIHIKV